MAKTKLIKEIVGFDSQGQPIYGDTIYPVTSFENVLAPGGHALTYIEELVDEAVAPVEAAETVRQSNEQGRTSAETQRVSNEQARTSAETQRASSEEDRRTYETARRSQETIRKSNEQTRQGNETTRQTNESTRQSQEQSRQQAESTRQTTFEANEATRQSTFEASEASRDTTFASKEATRDAANEAALNCAEELTELSQSLNSIGLIVRNGMLCQTYNV